MGTRWGAREGTSEKGAASGTGGCVGEHCGGKILSRYILQDCKYGGRKGCLALLSGLPFNWVSLENNCFSFRSESLVWIDYLVHSSCQSGISLPLVLMSPRSIKSSTLNPCINDVQSKSPISVPHDAKLQRHLFFLNHIPIEKQTFA
jgi:hypothetical protein